eukprot:TRINITY_DN3659_c0_g1_i2.p1 TRINITY_DN3659_c0_g1~~TRINITY_DN3659_c0_g1_i2.p1  ORF type:complete len:1194 (+),score=239.90 TRINITY_DN3659_c0_g1_i2:65-3646(+)
MCIRDRYQRRVHGESISIQRKMNANNNGGYENLQEEEENKQGEALHEDPNDVNQGEIPESKPPDDGGDEVGPVNNADIQNAAQNDPQVVKKTTDGKGGDDKLGGKTEKTQKKAGRSALKKGQKNLIRQKNEKKTEKQVDEKKPMTEAEKKMRAATMFRSYLRVFYLLLFILLLIIGVPILCRKALIQESIAIDDGSKLHFVSNNCQIIFLNDEPEAPMILRSSNKKKGNLRQKANDSANAAGSNPNKIEIEYFVPGAYDLIGDPSEVVFFADDKAYNQSDPSLQREEVKPEFFPYLRINNTQSESSCYAKIRLPGKVSFNDLSIHCPDKCSLIQDSKILSIKNTLKISGNNVALNSRNLKAKSLDFSASIGHFQANFLQLQDNSKITLDDGDIIIQSSEAMQIRFKHSMPSYCFSAPGVTQTTLKGCNIVNNNETPKVEEDDEEEPSQPEEKSGTTARNELEIDPIFNWRDYDLTTKRRHKKAKKLKHHQKISLPSNAFASRNERLLEETEEAAGEGETSKGEASGESDKKTQKTKKKAEDYNLPVYDGCNGTFVLCPSGSTCSPKAKLHVKAIYGNIFANIIQKEGEPASDKSQVKSGVIYKDGEVQLAPNSWIELEMLKDELLNTKTEPIFLFNFGSKKTYSSYFTQWALTFNPAYSYIKPWWMSIVSFRFLSGDNYIFNTRLNPGICPYRPYHSAETLLTIQETLATHFPNATRKVISYITNEKNPANINSKKVSTGFSYPDFSDVVGENWFTLKHDIGKSEIEFVPVDLDASSASRAALILSFIFGIVAGFNILLLLMYGISTSYFTIVDMVDGNASYAKVDREKKEEDSDPFGDKQEEKENEDIEDLEVSNVSLLKLSLSDLCNMVFNVAPPLAAYIDFFLLLAWRKYTNSVKAFYGQLFTPTTKQKLLDQELHETSNSEIKGSEIKMLYEKFCYLNHFNELQLNDSDNTQLLKKLGFHFDLREDSFTKAFVKLLCLRIEVLEDVPQDKSSLELFFEKCCVFTQFETDIVEFDEFMFKYEEFCDRNRLRKEFVSEGQLFNKYKLATKSVPTMYVTRAVDINTVPDDDEISWFKAQFGAADLYKIDRNKLLNHFRLVSYKINEIKTLTELEEAQKGIVKPPFWFIWDLLTVVMHVCIVVIFTTPFYAFIIFEKAEHADFSVKPDIFLIRWSDFLDNYLMIPFKLLHTAT